MILFYTAVYGLSPEDLSKFAPAKHDMTVEKPAGDYYKAYFELLDQIHPVTHKSKIVTPHIDRWWHVLTKMPDLNEESQAIQLNRILRAFFWGIVGGYIEYLPYTKIRNIYKVNGQSFLEEQKFEDLIVSNGTMCDHLYEVLDAFMIYPHLVTTVLKDVKKRDVRDTLAKKEFRNCVLEGLLKKLRFDEEGISGISKNTVRSVLELPLLMKWSVPDDDYDEDRMETFVRIIIKEIQDYVRRHTNEKEYVSVYSRVLKEQFDLFKENAVLAAMTVRNVLSDPMYVYICRTVAREYDSLDMIEERDAILEDLRKNVEAEYEEEDSFADTADEDAGN